METIALPRAVPPVLALGGFLKNTVCAATGRTAHLSPSAGNLDGAAAIAAFEKGVARLLDRLGEAPRLVAHDLHPDFPSTRFARSRDWPTLPVQHHQAHIAAVAAEHGHDGPLIGLALDGFGLGPGNQSWGGELLLCDGHRYRRLGHLAPLAQPGGDVAAREPWRMAAAGLHRLGRGGEIAARFAGHRAAALIGQVIESGVNAPQTTSCGRLFDAACGLLGVQPVAEFEGQAPMLLEAMATRPRALAGGWRIEGGVLDTLPLLAALADCDDPATGADLFHGTLAAALAEWAGEAAAEHGLRHVALGGGCFLNRVLSGLLDEGLRAQGLVPLAARRFSPGDQSLSLGQAWVAGLAAERGM